MQGQFFAFQNQAYVVAHLGRSQSVLGMFLVESKLAIFTGLLPQEAYREAVRGPYRALDLIAVGKPQIIALQETNMDEEESRQFSRSAAAQGYQTVPG